MKRFIGLSAVAVIAMALAAMPVCAQSRGGGGGSRGGGGGGGSYGGGHSSSMSSSRGGGGSYGGGSYGGGSTRSSGSYGGGSTRSSSYSGGGSTRGSSSYGGGSTRSGSSYSGGSSRSYSSGSTRSRGSSRSYSSASSTRGGSSYSPYSQGQRQSYQTRSQSSQPQRSIQGQGTASQRSGVTASGRPAPSRPYSPAGGQPQRVVIGHHDHGRIAPRHCDPMPFNRPCPFWGHGHHYFGYPVHYLPGRFVIHSYWGRDYYIIDNLYYRFYGDCYYVCRPPFGVFFDPILDGVALAACNIAYYATTCNAFRTINENANTITAQNQIIAQNNATIAEQNNQIALNSAHAAAAQLAADSAGLVQSYADINTEYFYDDGVFFTKGKDGKYVTIVPPAGALVKELPEDYDTITLDGKEYYKVDDTVFTTSVVNGELYFEVLGQMTGELAEKYDFNK